MLGRPTNLDNIRVRAYRACNRCGWRLFRHCFSLPFIPFAFCLGDFSIYPEILSQRAVQPNTCITNQPTVLFIVDMRHLFEAVR